MLLVGQYRARTALLVGTLDKVGIIPLAVGAYFSARAFFREQPPSPLEFNLLVWMSSGLGALYVGTVVLLHWVQRCDEVCLVLKHALQMHSSAHPKAAAVPERSGDQPAEVAPGPAAHHDR
jgi:hypothetical protein